MVVFGDASQGPPPRAIVSREAVEDNAIRVSVEWVLDDDLRQQQVQVLSSDDLQGCSLDRRIPLNDRWCVKLFQHPRAGRRTVLAMLIAADPPAAQGLEVIDLDEELIAVDTADGVSRRLENMPVCRPFRSDLSPLRGRRLLLLNEEPTDDRGAQQPLPAGTTDVIADADTVGPGLAVRVRLPDDATRIAHIAFDQLAVYD
jgi:hypothetical protein